MCNINMFTRICIISIVSLLERQPLGFVLAWFGTVVWLCINTTDLVLLLSICITSRLVDVKYEIRSTLIGIICLMFRFICLMMIYLFYDMLKKFWNVMYIETLSFSSEIFLQLIRST